MIERSARELPELAEMVSIELRAPLLAALSGYLSRRARSGALRTTPDVDGHGPPNYRDRHVVRGDRFSDPQERPYPALLPRKRSWTSWCIP